MLQCAGKAGLGTVVRDYATNADDFPPFSLIDQTALIFIKTFTTNSKFQTLKRRNNKNNKIA